MYDFISIGYQAALFLESRGCRIIIADKDDATESRYRIIRETKNENVVARKLDLSSLTNVRNFAKEIIKSEPHLHLLINNAGIGSVGMQHTEDGLQKTMQVNYYGHFLLTHLLLDLLKKSSPSRIIFTSSATAFWTKMNIADMNPPEDSSKLFLRSYAYSKLSFIIAAKCFANKLKGTGVTAYSFHPGVVRSPIYTRAIREDFNIGALLIGLWALIFGKNTEEGAQTLVHLACDDSVEAANGGFFSDCRRFIQPYQVYNDNFCEEVWNVSVKSVKLAPEKCSI